MSPLGLRWPADTTHATYLCYTWQWEQQINTKCCLNCMTLFSCWLHFYMSVLLQRRKEMLMHYQWHCTCRKPCPLPTCFPLFQYLGPPPVALLLAVSPAGPSKNDCTLVGHSSLDCLSFSYCWQATTFCILHKLSHWIPTTIELLLFLSMLINTC